MGLVFLMASIVVLFNLVEKPVLPEGPVKGFNEGMDAAPYFIPVLKVTELLCSIAFLTGRFVPLATVIIAPVIVHIFLFHLFLDRSGLPVASATEIVFQRMGGTQTIFSCGGPAKSSPLAPGTSATDTGAAHSPMGNAN